MNSSPNSHPNQQKRGPGFILSLAFSLILAIGSESLLAQVKIGDNPLSINSSSILEIEDTTRGVLMPRMTQAQRDAINTPPNGLMVYNTTNSTIDIYQVDQWVSTKYKNPSDNLVYVYSMEDLPVPSGTEITLDPTKMYVFSGIIDISPNYINMNGAALRGFNPSSDGVMSSVSGGVLRSAGKSVYIEDFATIPASATTYAYDFSDATGAEFCNLFSGASVVEIGIPSMGVGQISGFKAVTVTTNLWRCTDGVKVGGTIGKFTATTTFITDISSGSGITFKSDLVVDDIDLTNNYFVYTGQTGVKVEAGATIDRGRMTSNMFRGVTTRLDGFDSYTIGWFMSQNTSIPDSRAYGYLYMNDNTADTATTPNDTYVKVAGTTAVGNLQKFTSPSDNRLVYKGREEIVAKIFISITGVAPANDSQFSVAVAKNGTAVPTPFQSSAAMGNNQVFTLILETEASMVTDDYIEAVIKTTSSNSPITITSMQFRVVN